MSKLSQITGADASHNASVAGNEASAQYTNAQDARAQAQAGYSNLSNMGYADLAGLSYQGNPLNLGPSGSVNSGIPSYSNANSTVEQNLYNTYGPQMGNQLYNMYLQGTYGAGSNGVMNPAGTGANATATQQSPASNPNAVNRTSSVAPNVNNPAGSTAVNGYGLNAPYSSYVYPSGGSGYGTIAQLGLDAYGNAVTGAQSALGQYDLAAGLATPAGYNTATSYSNGTGGTTSNPYDLSPAEQAELNAQIDQLSQAHQNTTNNLNAVYAARGISNPASTAAAQALVNQAYQSAINSHSAQYAEAARANRQSAAQNLLSYYNTQQNGGAGLLTTGISGANNLISGGTTGVANLSNAYQNAAQSFTNQQNQQQSSSNASFGNVINLGLKGLTGGFSNPFSSGGGSTGNSGGSSSSSGGGLGSVTDVGANDAASTANYYNLAGFTGS